MCIPINERCSQYRLYHYHYEYTIWHYANNFRAVRGVGASHTRPVSQAIGRFVLRLVGSALFFQTFLHVVLFRSRGFACRVFGTVSLRLKLLAGSGDLKALAYGSQTQSGRDRAAVPFHEWGWDLEYFLAVVADHLSLVAFLLLVGHVVL